MGTMKLNRFIDYIEPTTDVAEAVISVSVENGRSPSIQSVGALSGSEEVAVLQPGVTYNDGITFEAWEPVLFQGEAVKLNADTNRLNLDTGLYKITKPATVNPVGVRVWFR